MDEYEIIKGMFDLNEWCALLVVLEKMDCYKYDCYEVYDFYFCELGDGLFDDILTPLYEKYKVELLDVLRMIGTCGNKKFDVIKKMSKDYWGNYSDKIEIEEFVKQFLKEKIYKQVGIESKIFHVIQEKIQDEAEFERIVNISLSLYLELKAVQFHKKGLLCEQEIMALIEIFEHEKYKHIDNFTKILLRKEIDSDFIIELENKYKIKVWDIALKTNELDSLEKFRMVEWIETRRNNMEKDNIAFEEYVWTFPFLDRVGLLKKRSTVKNQMHTIKDLKGLGKELWKEVDVEEYINKERDSWE